MYARQGPGKGSNLSAVKPRATTARADSATDVGLAVARPAIGVDAELRAERAAQQVVDGLPGGLARDVPQRLLEAADGAVQLHRAPLAAEVGIRRVGEVLDVERAPADEVPSEGSGVRLDGALAVGLRIAFAPAVQAIVGLDLHEEPVLVRAGIDQERPDALDLHIFSCQSAASRSSAARGRGPFSAAAAAYSRCSNVE